MCLFQKCCIRKLWSVKLEKSCVKFCYTQMLKSISSITVLMLKFTVLNKILQKSIFTLKLN